MKTNYFLITMLLLLSMTSCSTYYRMTSRVERDGSMYREIYALSSQEIRHIIHFCFNRMPTGN